MSRKKKHKAHANHERWLVSYADFITLLFAFFVVLYASSQADKKKQAQVAASIKGAFQELGVFTGSAVKDVGIPGSPGVTSPELTDAPLHLVKVAGTGTTDHGAPGFGVDVDELRRQLENALGDEIRQHEVKMRVTPEGLVVSMREVGFFNSGEAELLENGHTALTRIATILGGRGFEIRVEGHTDNVPVHNARFKSNWELSTARAVTVVALLVERHGFDPVTGLGGWLFGISSRCPRTLLRRGGQTIEESIWSSSGARLKKTRWLKRLRRRSVRRKSLRQKSQHRRFLRRPVSSGRKPSPVVLQQVSAPPKISR